MVQTHPSSPTLTYFENPFPWWLLLLGRLKKPSDISWPLPLHFLVNNSRRQGQRFQQKICFHLGFWCALFQVPKMILEASKKRGGYPVDTQRCSMSPPQTHHTLTFVGHFKPKSCDNPVTWHLDGGPKTSPRMQRLVFGNGSKWRYLKETPIPSKFWVVNHCSTWWSKCP